MTTAPGPGVVLAVYVTVKFSELPLMDTDPGLAEQFVAVPEQVTTRGALYATNKLAVIVNWVFTV